MYFSLYDNEINLPTYLWVRDESSDHIIMHVGTNDLNSENNPEREAKSIDDVAIGMVSEKRKVTISGIIPRNDKWNKKAQEVNQHLKNICQIASIDYIDNSSLNPKKHLNNSNLHLNERGSYKINSVFLNYITILFKWYESESPVGKDSLYDSVSLNQSDNETTESDSTTLSSSNLNFESRCFGDELKSLRINNINRVIIVIEST